MNESDNSDINSKIEKNPNVKLILFTEFETSLVKKMIAVRKGGRKYFLASFTSMLNSKINILGITCRLRSKFNWFKKDDGRKRNIWFWRGCYICVDKNCLINYTATIKNSILNEFELSLEWNGFALHSMMNSVIAKPRCTGDSRKALALRIIANGISNTRNEIILNRRKSSICFFLERNY